MFCKNCGKQLDDAAKFCDGCGTTVGDASNQTAQTQGQQQYQQPNNQPNVVMTSDNTKVFSILAYIGILFIVGLIADPNNQKVKFHVNQGLILLIADIALGISVAIVGAILGIVPIIGGIIAALLLLADYAFVITFAIMGIVNAAKGEEKQLPIIGSFVLIK